MPKKESLETGEDRKAKDFVKKNWPLALAFAGAAGAVGAAVWLTARYLREKKKREALEDEALRLAEIEVEQMSDPTAVMLETGSYLGEVSGDEAVSAAEELSHNTDDPDARDALQVLKHVSTMGSSSNKKRIQK